MERTAWAFLSQPRDCSSVSQDIIIPHPTRRNRLCPTATPPPDRFSSTSTGSRPRASNSSPPRTARCRRRSPNRAPKAEEAANCRGFLDRTLELVGPKFICCLGAVAAQNLLGVTTSIGKMRGRFFDYNGMTVMCTYHPSYLLRSESPEPR